MLISIIIPIYNSQEFIKDCFESVLSQMRDDVEVILVDDGSTDNGVHLVEEMIENSPARENIKIIRQPNTGPGAARNKGISESAGDYIGFLDSDDLLDQNYVKTISKIININSPDLIEFPFRRFVEKDKIPKHAPDGVSHLHGFHQLDDIRVELFAKTSWFPCTRVYRRSAFEGIEFPERVHYEDLMTIPFIFLKSLSIYFHDGPLLAYRHNLNSITSVHSRKQACQLHEFFNSLDAGNNVALKLLKLRVARTLMFFLSEFGSPRTEVDAVIYYVRSISLPSNIQQMLLPADRYFFRHPWLYSQLERIRAPVKRFIAGKLRQSRAV